MRKFASVVSVIVLAATSALAAPKMADAAVSQDKAQQLTMQKYPGANILSSKMQDVKGNSVWVVTFTRTGGNVSEKVMVDANTGKVTKM